MNIFGLPSLHWVLLWKTKTKTTLDLEREALESNLTSVAYRVILSKSLYVSALISPDVEIAWRINVECLAQSNGSRNRVDSEDTDPTFYILDVKARLICKKGWGQQRAGFVGRLDKEGFAPSGKSL